MANIRKPNNKEGLKPKSDTRSERLRDLVCSGKWYDNNKIVLIYFSPEKGGRWVMWKDPDPLRESGVTIGAPDDSDDSN